MALFLVGWTLTYLFLYFRHTFHLLRFVIDNFYMRRRPGAYNENHFNENDLKIFSFLYYQYFLCNTNKFATIHTLTHLA